MPMLFTTGCGGATFGAGWSAYSQGCEPGEDVGLGTVDTGCHVGRPSAVEGCLLDGHVGVEVSVGAVGVGVPEPQRDDRDVDASGEQVHRPRYLYLFQ